MIIMSIHILYQRTITLKIVSYGQHLMSQRIELSLVTSLFARHLKSEILVNGVFFSCASHISSGYRKLGVSCFLYSDERLQYRVVFISGRNLSYKGEIA